MADRIAILHSVKQSSRLSRGKMMGVDFNSTKTWVGRQEVALHEAAGLFQANKLTAFRVGR